MSHYLAVSLRRSRNFPSLLISSQRYQRQFLSTSTKAIAVSTPEEIVDECSRLRASLQSLNDVSVFICMLCRIMILPIQPIR